MLYLRTWIRIDKLVQVEFDNQSAILITPKGGKFLSPAQTIVYLFWHAILSMVEKRPFERIPVFHYNVFSATKKTDKLYKTAYI